MCQEFETTEFLTIALNKTLTAGIAIGQGECKAVRLKLNALQRNTALALQAGLFIGFYYGDSERQEAEYSVLGVAGTSLNSIADWTPLIYCKDLSDVFIRYAAKTANAGWPDTIQVQVMVHR